MKKIGILAASVFAAGVLFAASSAYADDITIKVNGETLVTETPAIIANDRTLVPLRAITEAIGIDVSWDGDTKGITLTDGQSLFFTWIGRDHAFKTSSMALEDYTVLEAPPVIMNDFTMVPLRAISEMFGAQVNWDNQTRTVTVEKDNIADVPKGTAEKFLTYEQIFNIKYEAYSDYADGTANTLTAVIELENGGVIEAELYPDIAPITVDNFVSLANSGFYDGLIFHRVIPNFMIQGGGFDAELNAKDADEIRGEFIANGYFNLIPHERGVLSMARTMASNDSASSQFFIMHADTHSLDGQYAAFGKVVSGMEYVDDIAATQTTSYTNLGMDDVPVEPQIIKSVTIK